MYKIGITKTNTSRDESEKERAGTYYCAHVRARALCYDGYCYVYGDRARKQRDGTRKTRGRSRPSIVSETRVADVRALRTPTARAHPHLTRTIVCARARTRHRRARSVNRNNYCSRVVSVRCALVRARTTFHVSRSASATGPRRQWRIYGGGLVGYIPSPEFFSKKNLKIILKRTLYFNGAICLFRIRVQRRIVLGHSANEM
jgi:hypothetical protein